MAEPIKGDENIPAKVPAQEPVKTNTEEKKPDPEAGKEKKEDDKVTEVLNANDQALRNAEAEIVRLKKELKEKKGGDTPPDDSGLREQIQSLTEEVANLKSSLTPREDDKAVEELHSAQKKNEELRALLISKNTAGKGEGAGGNQDTLKPETPTESFAKTPQERAILERRGIDPMTGKKKP